MPHDPILAFQLVPLTVAYLTFLCILEWVKDDAVRINPVDRKR
jgi:hypothetical protein